MIKTSNSILRELRKDMDSVIMICKISPCPSFPKRGIRDIPQKSWKRRKGRYAERPGQRY
jgi:hypothetical protein